MKKLILLFVLLNSIVNAQVPVTDSIVGSSSICSAPSSNNYSVFATNSPTSYSWSVIPATSIVIANPTNSVTSVSFPYSSASYTLFCSATNTVGTSATSSSLEIIVNETPTAIISGSNSFCQNSSTNLTASASIISATPTVNYSWAPNIGLNTTIGSSVIANPNVTIIYTITATKGVCQNVTEFTVTPISNPIISDSTQSQICVGNSAVITAFGANTYTWSNAVIANSITVSPTVTTNYTVTGTSTLTGCKSSKTLTVSIGSACVVSASSPSPTICYGQSTPIGAGTGDYFSWSCSPSPCVIGATTINHSSYATVSPTITTTYFVTATVWFQPCPCTASVTINVVSCIGVKEFNNESVKGINIYPNPANDLLNVSFETQTQNTYTIKILDVTAKVLIEQNCNSTCSIKLNTLQNGIYFVNLYDGNALLSTKKIVIIK